MNPPARGQLLQRIHVDLVPWWRDLRAHRARADLQQILPARKHRVLMHPDEGGLELVGHFGRFRGGGQQIAAGNIDLPVQRQRDGLSGNSLFQIAIVRDDAFDPGFLARRQRADAIAHGDLAAGDLPREAAEILIRAIDPLHRQAEGPFTGFILHLHGFQMLHQRAAGVPRHGRAAAGDVLALECRHRYAGDVGQPYLLCELPVLRNDGVECALCIPDGIHLVHGQHDVPDAQQRHDVAVAPGLRQHALARIDQDHCQIGRGSASDHVARVLLVAGRIGDDEFALLGGEEAIGHVDGDALLALRGQPVDQQREVQLLALRAVLLRVGIQCGELILVDQFGFVQQPADQRALAVIDAAAGDETQQVLVLVGLEIAEDVLTRQIDVVGHQK
jgi:hypothetical protein